MLLNHPVNEMIVRKLVGSEIQEQRESDGIGERVIFLEGLQIAEINPEDIVADTCPEGQELPVTVVGRLVKISAPESEHLVIPVFGTNSNHQLLRQGDFHSFLRKSIKTLVAVPRSEQGFKNGHGFAGGVVAGHDF